MKSKEIQLYMDFAHRVSKMSHAVRLKVGAVLARPNGSIVSYGYNDMPTGMDNCCEVTVNGVDLVTRPEVIHAECNAIMKAAKEGRSTQGAWLFITHSPCIDCAKLILQADIRNVIYRETYRSLSGVNFLNNSGVHCINHEEKQNGN